MKLDKGPAEYLRALRSGDPEQIKEALEFQRESFRAKFGCYPEDLECDHQASGRCQRCYGLLLPGCEYCDAATCSCDDECL